ncbi:hypothetical protein [Actinokineospora pegani]|uniref:hypothetical protein n=1 Tax=Actinokineospora pegani TaxID=2654637 RepID=UPI0012EABF6E|nr:hypothetical protein [Actinokineospora pegani]
MVGVLIRMRVSLLRNTLTGMQAVTLGLGAVFGLAFAGLGVWLALLDLGAATGDLLALLFLLWALGWAVGPVFLGGSGGALAPESFAALPIPPRTLATGLLAASFVGVGPVVTLVAFAAGVVYAVGSGSVAVTVAVLAMLLQLLVVVVFSKVVVDLVGAAITSTARAVVSAIPWALLGGVVAQSWLLLPLVSRVDGFDPAVSTALRVLPSGWGLLAVDAAARGDWLVVGAALAGLVVLFALLLLTWSRLIVRRTTRVVTVRPASARGGGRAGVRSGPLRLLPASPVGAVVAKELRTTVRDLNRALLLSYAIFFGLSVTLVPLLVGDTTYLAATGVIVALLATTGSAQLYSNDGTALWLTVLAPGTERADVRGRQLAWLLLVAPLSVVLTAVGLPLSGADWAAPWAWALLPAALGGGAGAIVLVSVFALVPMADPKKRARSAAGGDGSTGLVAWAMLPLSLLTVLPAAVFPLVGMLLDSPALQWAGVPVGLATGVLSLVLGGALAHRRLADQGPELFARMRSGPQSTIDFTGWAAGGRAPAAAAPQRPMPLVKASLVWALYLVGFVTLVAQVGVASVLSANGATVRAWFLALYLPQGQRPAVLAALAALAVAAIVGGWLLSRGHDKPARKKFGLL